MKEKICNALELVIAAVFYGGVVLAVCGLCMVRWSLCWMGLMLAAVAIVVIAVTCVTDDLRSIAKHNSLARIVSIGWRVVAEAVACIFLWLVVAPVVLFTDGIVKGIKGLSMST